MFQGIAINLEREIVKRLLMCVGGLFINSLIVTNSAIPPPNTNFPFIYFKQDDET